MKVFKNTGIKARRFYYVMLSVFIKTWYIQKRTYENTVNTGKCTLYLKLKSASAISNMSITPFSVIII